MRDTASQIFTQEEVETVMTQLRRTNRRVERARERAHREVVEGTRGQGHMKEGVVKALTDGVVIKGAGFDAQREEEVGEERRARDKGRAAGALACARCCSKGSRYRSSRAVVHAPGSCPVT